MESSRAIEILSALAHEGRLAIFRLLVRRAPDAVAAGEIALAMGVRGSTMSNQLGELERVGLIRSHRKGRSILYRADLGAAGGLLAFLATDCCKGRPEACLPIANAVFGREDDFANTCEQGDGMERPYNVLFLCVGNSARSIFAEAILKRVAPRRFNAYSAGSHPRGEVHPRAAALLKHLNYDLGGYRSKSWDEFAQDGAPPLDFVFTVCDKAANEICPVWPGQPMTAHWGVPDPAEATGSETEIGLAFTEAYRYLFNRISAFSALPIEGLDKLALQKQLDEIGRQAPAADDDTALRDTA